MKVTAPLIATLALSLTLLFVFNNQFGEIQNVVDKESCYYINEYGFPLWYNNRGQIYFEKLFVNFIYFVFIVLSSILVIAKLLDIFKTQKYSVLKYLSATSLFLITGIFLILLLGIDHPDAMSCRPFTIYEQRGVLIFVLVTALISWILLSSTSYLVYKISQLVWKRFVGKKFKEWIRDKLSF